MQLQNNNQEVEQIHQSKSVMTPLKKVTPLSKYLAMALFLMLPFVGGYIGYQYAPEKMVEVEKVIEVERVESVDLHEKRNLVAKNSLLPIGSTLNFSDPETDRYIVSEKELFAQGYLNPADKGKPQYLDYYAEKVVKVDDEHVILAVSTNPAGFTSSYLVNEIQKEVVRALENGQRNINAVSDWYYVAEGGTSTTYQLVVLDNQVLLIDYVNDVEQVLYTESDSNVSLLESCDRAQCFGDISRTANGNVRVSRFFKNDQPNGSIQGEYIDTIEITIQDEYKQFWLRS